MCDLLKLNKDEINNLNRIIITSETKVGNKILWSQKSPEPGEFSTNFDQTFKELTLTLSKLFCTIEIGERYPNLPNT